MRRIICCECGKSYDYDKDEFCPKCGAYNPPDGRAGFSDHAQIKGGDAVTRCAKGRIFSREFQEGDRSSAHAAHYRGKPGRTVLLVVVVIFLLAALAAALSNSPTTDSVEPAEVSHRLNSAFQAAGKQYTLSNPRWAAPSDGLLETFGCDGDAGSWSCLLVDVRITTTDLDRNDEAPASVLFRTPSCKIANMLTPLTEEAQVWADAQGIQIVDPAACAENTATVSGQLLFLLHESWLEDPASLVICEGDPQNPRVTHIIDLDLSALPFPVAAVSAAA